MICSHLIIVRIFVSRGVFLMLMVHHFLHTSPYKTSVFVGNIQSFFQEL